MTHCNELDGANVLDWLRTSWWMGGALYKLILHTGLNHATVLTYFVPSCAALLPAVFYTSGCQLPCGCLAIWASGARNGGVRACITRTHVSLLLLSATRPASLCVLVFLMQFIADAGSGAESLFAHKRTCVTSKKKKALLSGELPCLL